MEQIFNRLIDLVQQTAPQLWQIARQQVVAQIVLYWLGVSLGILLIGSAIGLIALVRKHSNWSDDSKLGGIIGACIIGVIGLLITLTSFNDALLYQLNPDYYAIQVLLQLTK